MLFKSSGIFVCDFFSPINQLKYEGGGIYLTSFFGMHHLSNLVRNKIRFPLVLSWLQCLYTTPNYMAQQINISLITWHSKINNNIYIDNQNMELN